MSNKVLDWKEQLKTICEILKRYGIDIQQIQTRKTSAKDGKREFVTLGDIEIDGFNIKNIIKDNSLEEDFPIGKYIYRFRLAYNGTKGKLTDEEIQYGERLGIVQKKIGMTPIFKGRKISQFHINYINKLLDRILTGELNTVEAMQLLKEESIKQNETILKDTSSIKRIVEILLKDRPDDLKRYNEIVKKNSGNRNPYKGKIGKTKLGSYHQEKFKQEIIETYLPKILSGETTLDVIKKELNTSHDTINKIITEYFYENDDLDGLEAFKIAKRKNAGTSLEKRESAKNMRKEVEKYEVVSNAEFLLLSPELQEKQILMKIRVEQLKEEKSRSNNIKTAVLREETTVGRIEKIMNYFRNKNTSDREDLYFSDEDIRYMIFRYPTLINRNENTLDEKIKILTSYEEINEINAYGMIKTFPAIIGYDVERTKKQLDLLEKERLIDYAISKPSVLMRSVDLMYALIEFAKERHHTNNLDEVNRNNIFMPNPTLKRLYGTNYAELKQKYQYIGTLEEDEEYKVLPENLLVPQISISTVIDAENVLDFSIKEIENSKGKENE